MLILSSSPRLFGSIAYDSTGSGNFIGRERDRVALVAERVVGQRVLQLGDRAEIAGLDLRHARLRLALQQQQVAEALGRVARLVVDGRIGLERAGDDAEHRDPSGERIGNGLPHERGGRFLLVGVARDLGAGLVRRRETADRPATADSDDRVEQLLDADVERSPTCRPAETASPAMVAPRSPAISSSSVSVPASKNFSISFSSFSATISMSASRAASTAAVMSAGHGAFGELAALVGLEDVRPSS